MFILKGIPGCGKSTQAAEMIRKEPRRFVRINRDDLRRMCVGPGNNPHANGFAKEELVKRAKDALTELALAEGYDVILDDTHLNGQTVKKLHLLAESHGDVKVVERFIDVDIRTCIERDSKRTGLEHVGEDVIRRLAASAGIHRGKVLANREAYYPGTSSNELVEREGLPTAIMCDLDGTLAIVGDRSPYDATDCDLTDEPNQPVVECVLAMHAAGHSIIFMSGRDEKYRPETTRFIEAYCRVGNVVVPYELHMRGELTPDRVDSRKDAIVKRELFDAFVRGKYNVLFVLDDRDQVVSNWRRMGLICFQVAPGRF